MSLPATRDLLLGAGLVLAVAGCATAGSVRSEPDDMGRAFEFTEACEVLVELVPPTLAELGFRLDSVEPAGPCGVTVVAVKPVSLASWGEVVRVIVAPDSAGGTLVRVHTRRALATNVTALGDWSARIHQALLDGVQARQHEPAS